MKQPSWLIRIIECYSVETEELVSETVLPHVELSALQRRWHMPENEPMISCFAIDANQARFLGELTGMDFDFKRYSYFLSSYTTDLAASHRDGGFMGLFPPPRELSAVPSAKRVLPKTPET